MQNTYLTAAQRAAKRVAQMHLDAAETFDHRNASILGFAKAVNDRFATGRKLDDREFSKIAQGLRSRLAGSSMLELHETSQPATRTRPNGEAFEILALNRLVREERGAPIYSLNSTRAFLSHKKFVIDSSFAPVATSKHLLARSIERGVARDDELDLLDRAIVDSIGLTTVWQRAFSKGAAPTEAIMVPYGGGALLGRISARSESEEVPVRVNIDRNASRQGVYDASPFHTYSDDDGVWRASVLLATAIDESLLNREQYYLQAELDRFQARYGQALREITRAALWPHAVLTESMGLADIDYCIDNLAEELSTILMQPDHAYALRGPRVQRREWVNTGTIEETATPEQEPVRVLWLKSA